VLFFNAYPDSGEATGWVCVQDDSPDVWIALRALS
jgi:hypothetical protein